MSTAVVGHPPTKHQCQPVRLDFSANEPVGVFATLRLDGKMAADVAGVVMTFDPHEFVKVTVRYEDGTEDTYEAEQLAVSVAGRPICPTGEHV